MLAARRTRIESPSDVNDVVDSSERPTIITTPKLELVEKDNPSESSTKQEAAEQDLLAARQRLEQLGEPASAGQMRLTRRGDSVQSHRLFNVAHGKFLENISSRYVRIIHIPTEFMELPDHKKIQMMQTAEKLITQSSPENAQLKARLNGQEIASLIMLPSEAIPVHLDSFDGATVFITPTGFVVHDKKERPRAMQRLKKYIYRLFGKKAA